MNNLILQAVNRTPFDPSADSLRTGNSAATSLLFDISAFLFCEHGGHHVVWNCQPGPSVEDELEQLKRLKPHLYDTLKETSLSVVKRTGEVLSRYNEMTASRKTLFLPTKL